MKHNKSLAFLRSYVLCLFLVCITHAYGQSEIESSTPSINPSAEEYLELAKFYAEKSDKEKALAYYEKTIAVSSGMDSARLADIHINAGNILREKDSFDAALKHYAQALQLHPTHLTALMELGNTLNMLDRDPESITLYMRVLELKPDMVSALHNFGFTLKKMGRYEDAIKVFRKLLEITPNYGLGHFNLAATLLTIGNFKEGWSEYEWRWQAYGESPKRFSQPLWDGADIAGKKILIYSEQGLGDTFEFIRYAQILKEKGAHVIFETQAAAADILRLCKYIDQVVVRNQPLPQFDYQVPLMSLPLILGTTIETVPNNIPYLHADAKLIDYWKQRLSSDKNFKIGICWHGNGNYPTQALRRAVAAKSVPLNLFASLAKIPNVSVYSLQQVDGLNQLNELDPSIAIHQFSGDFDKTHGRFMDTAAVMKNLDLVVSVDTSIIHLAGGLDVNAFLILPTPADWRWIVDRQDSPWYPKIRIFQQETPGEWGPVIQRIKNTVESLVNDNATKLKKNIIDPAALEKNITNIIAQIVCHKADSKDKNSEHKSKNDPSPAQSTEPVTQARPTIPTSDDTSENQSTSTSTISFTDKTRHIVQEELARYQHRFGTQR